MAIKLSVYDVRQVCAHLQASVSTKHSQQIILNIIGPDHTTPLNTIFICKHPAATKRHTADGHIPYHCHCLIKPLHRGFSWADAISFWLLLSLPLATVLLTTHMILQASAMIVNYWGTASSARKSKPQRHAYNS